LSAFTMPVVPSALATSGTMKAMDLYMYTGALCYEKC
jgi:hypothetical protein